MKDKSGDALARAQAIIAGLDDDKKSRLAKLFSSMEFKKDPTLKQKIKGRKAKQWAASNG